MQIWRRRFWLRGAVSRQRGRGEGLLLSVALGIGLALLVISMVDQSARPIIIEMAQTKAENAITRIVNDAVNRTLSAQTIAYEDMVTLQKDAGGQITALTSNSVEMNRLRTQILDEIVMQVDALDSKELGVPLGNLTGVAGFSDQGPTLPVRVLSVASAEGSFRNVFTAAGINQSYHKIVLDVVVSVKLMIPGSMVETGVSTPVNVAETIIVGKVPDAYLQFGTQTE